MTLKIVETRSLKLGQPVIDYFVDRASADTYLKLVRKASPDPATADDLSGAAEWPFAVVPNEVP